MTSVNNKSTTSAEIESDDLLHEILLRLPAYSIHRLKTACKQWQSLITSPIFVKLWRKRNIKPSTGLVFNNYSTRRPNYFVPLYSNNIPTTIPPLRNGGLRVIQSCNGLLLCKSKPLICAMNSRRVYHEYYVYNPTTDTCHTLPQLRGKLASDCRISRIQAMRFAFDPNRSLYYKVICFVRFDHKALRVYIYSSDTRIWKLISKPFCGIVNNEGVYWNGAIHWMNTLVYFNIEHEGFKAMPMPPNYLRKLYYFGESCDRLNYVPLLKSSNLCSVHVYELKRDYSEWILKYHVEFDYLFNNTFVLSVVRGVDEDDMFLVLGTMDGIVRHNIVSETSEKLSDASGVFFRRAFQYIESQYCV